MLEVVAFQNTSSRRRSVWLAFQASRRNDKHRGGEARDKIEIERDFTSPFASSPSTRTKVTTASTPATKTTYFSWLKRIFGPLKIGVVK
jgi:hypothetical protein